MTLSILIVSYKVPDLLLRCLASLPRDVETIVIDNASGDLSVERVRDAFPWVKLIALPENVGFSAAVNRAAQQATSDAFLLLNPDAFLPPNAVPRMLEVLEAHPEAVAFGFRQVDEQGRFQLSFGLAPTLFQDALRGVVQRALDRGCVPLGRLIDAAVAHTTKVPWVSGSSLLVRRRDFQMIGGFDEDFFLYFEDFDFCLRLRDLFGVIYYEPSITVVHRRGASAAVSGEAAQRAYRDSQLRFWHKHRGALVGNLVAGYLHFKTEVPES